MKKRSIATPASSKAARAIAAKAKTAQKSAGKAVPKSVQKHAAGKAPAKTPTNKTPAPLPIKTSRKPKATSSESGANKALSKTPGRPKDPGKHRAILQAAQVHFLTHGFERANMDAIARDAGVSKLTIYGHFGSKEALFQQVIGQKCQEFHLREGYPTLPPGPLAPDAVRAALVDIAERFVELFYQPEVIQMHRVIISEAGHNPKVARLFYQAGPEQVKPVFAAFLQGLQRAGGLFLPDPALAGEHFIHLIKGELHFKAVLNLIALPTKREQRAYMLAGVNAFLRSYAPHFAAPGTV